MWKPIGPEHKDGEWVVAIHQDDPDNKAIVWWNEKSRDYPWVGSAGDHDYREGAFTHAFPLPAPPHHNI
jgi:hypothetical protein